MCPMALVFLGPLSDEDWAILPAVLRKAAMVLQCGVVPSPRPMKGSVELQ